MSPRVRIVGSYLSPYVRKVLACLNLKGLDYEIDPIVPFMGDDRFTALSPLRRIPVLIDDRVTLADSSVICQYLEDCYPEPAIYPIDIANRARARWLEEYADTRIGDVLLWRLFNAAVVGPSVRGGRATWRRSSASSVRRSRPCSITSRANCRAGASCSGPWASRTSRSRRSSATRPLRAIKSMRRAGPSPRGS
jgi:glutathione S-transferase